MGANKTAAALPRGAPRFDCSPVAQLGKSVAHKDAGRNFFEILYRYIFDISY
jgi:hypothetical protein